MFEETPSPDEGAMVTADTATVAGSPPRDVASTAASYRGTHAAQCEMVLRSRPATEEDDAVLYQTALNQLAAMLPPDFCYQGADPADTEAAIVSGASHYIALLQDLSLSLIGDSDRISSPEPAMGQVTGDPDQMSSPEPVMSHVNGDPGQISSPEPAMGHATGDPDQTSSPEPVMSPVTDQTSSPEPVMSHVTDQTSSAEPDSFSSSDQKCPAGHVKQENGCPRTDHVAASPEPDYQIFVNNLFFENNNLSVDSTPLSRDKDSIPTEKPGVPKRPKNGFIRFSMEHRKWLGQEHPKADNREISKMLGAKWRRMSTEERKPYEKEFESDMRELRAHFPEWRYTSAKRRMDDRVEPMPTRLRDRRFLKRKIPPLKEMLGRKCRTPRRERDSGQSLWVRCGLCSKWRKLTASADVASLPPQWYCALNPDFRFNACDMPQESKASPDADDFLSVF